MGASIFFSKLSLKIVRFNGALRHTAEAWWGTNRPRLAECLVLIQLPLPRKGLEERSVSEDGLHHSSSHLLQQIHLSSLSMPALTLTTQGFSAVNLMWWNYRIPLRAVIEIAGRKCFPVTPFSGSCLEGNCFICADLLISISNWAKESTSERRKSSRMSAKPLSTRYLLKQNIVWMLSKTTSHFIKFSKWLLLTMCIDHGGQSFRANTDKLGHTCFYSDLFQERNLKHS